MVAQSANLRLGARDRLILWHVLRYGATHKEVIFRRFFTQGQHKVEAARKQLRRLTDGGLLSYFKEPWPYHRLSASGVRLIETLLRVPPDSHRAACRPFKTATTLFERNMILAFCCLATTPRQVLLRYELERWFPKCARKGTPSWPYLLDHKPNGAILAHLVVDSGSGASSQLRRIRKKIDQRISMPGMMELERHGRFRVYFLTETNQRADDIRRILRDADISIADVQAVPELTSIAPGSYAR